MYSKSVSLLSKIKTPQTPLDFDTITSFFQRYQARISFVVTVFFAVFTAWLFGALIWGFFTSNTQVTPWRPQSVSGVQLASGAQVEIENILKANLFGEYENKDKAHPTTPVKALNAPPTRLQLTLTGVVASNNAEYSLAIIDSQGKQNTYNIGDDIDKTRAKLTAVLIDRVIINNAGKDETLMLEGKDYSKIKQPKVSKKSASSNTNNKLKVEELNRLKTELSASPENIFKYIRLSRVEQGGKLKGYKVRPGKTRALFDEVGLKDGDIAIMINDKDLTDPNIMTEVLKSSQQDTSWTLLVERNSQRHEIQINF